MASLLTAEEMARREFELRLGAGTVRIEVGVSFELGVPLATEDAPRKEVAVFKEMTFGDNDVLMRAATYESGSGRDYKQQIDVNEYRRIVLKRNLLSWTLDIPIERENGWMTNDCWDRVRRVSAPVLEAFIDKYEKTMTLSQAEDERIDRQGAILFAAHGGVAEPCLAVSRFCTLGSFWEKFGIRREQLQEMSYLDYLRLRKIMAAENEAHARAARKPAGGSRATTGRKGQQFKRVEL